jgi:CelD/BcsL family acetyltransferase involved in cellulose biosynthesis
MARINIISTIDEFRGLKDEWNDVLNKSNTNTIFLTWEWLYTWWEVLGRGAELFIVVSRDENGRLEGMAPLHIRKTRYYKFPTRELTFIGMGLSDRQDFIATGNGEKVTDGLLRVAFENRAKWDVMHLEQIPEHSYLMKSKTAGQFGCFIEASSICPFVSIAGTWDSYSKTLGKKFWKDVRNKSNKMNRLGKWEFQVDRNGEDSKGTISMSEEIERKSRKEGTEKIFLSDPSNREFLCRFGETSVQNGWFDYSKIVLNNSVIAYLIGFVYDGKYCAYNTAYDKGFFEASPGKLLLNEKIKWCFRNADHANEFDFLRGDFYVKSLWATDSRQHYRIVIFKPSMYSSLIKATVFGVRPILKRIKDKWKRSERAATDSE